MSFDTEKFFVPHKDRYDFYLSREYPGFGVIPIIVRNVSEGLEFLIVTENNKGKKGKFSFAGSETGRIGIPVDGCDGEGRGEGMDCNRDEDPYCNFLAGLYEEVFGYLVSEGKKEVEVELSCSEFAEIPFSEGAMAFVVVAEIVDYGDGFNEDNICAVDREVSDHSWVSAEWLMENRGNFRGVSTDIILYLDTFVRIRRDNTLKLSSEEGCKLIEYRRRFMDSKYRLRGMRETDK